MLTSQRAPSMANSSALMECVSQQEGFVTEETIVGT